MQIKYHSQFKKNFKKRIGSSSTLACRFADRLSLLLEDPTNPKLRAHRLNGSQRSFFAFSVTGDVRCVYRIEGKTIILFDIGTHNQVY